MNKGNSNKGPANKQSGIARPPSINPDVFALKGRKIRKVYSEEEYISGIFAGNRTILSQAITLVESSLPEHYDLAQSIVEKCLPQSARSVRIGITGAPGAGKSTFIETLGLHLTSVGRRLAVLTIDPSSEQTNGSILGDKTRMDRLGIHPDVFIRPSPATGTLGGVSKNTRETIILCEAAGFDTILVETVGVGQSETTVHSMVDFFLLLMLAGSGDELQGIKRGIMEMADLITITKADGPGKSVAESTRMSFQNAIDLFPPKPSGWKPPVLTCSALQNTGITELWEIVEEYFNYTTKSGYFQERRNQQSKARMHNTITEYLNNSFYNLDEVRLLLPSVEKQLYEGSITSYKAALYLLDKWSKR